MLSLCPSYYLYGFKSNRAGSSFRQRHEPDRADGVVDGGGSDGAGHERGEASQPEEEFDEEELAAVATVGDDERRARVQQRRRRPRRRPKALLRTRRCVRLQDDADDEVQFSIS